MSDEFRQNGPAAPQQGEQDVVALIKRIQQQLSFLDRKIDGLISQLQERRPPRSFGRPHHHGREGHRDRSEERDFDRPRHFEKRHEEDNRGFDKKKKPFYYSRRKHRG